MSEIMASVRRTAANGWRYCPLLANLVSRDLKKKYRTSFLGYLWCVLNPLLIMIIMTLVFSRMFKNSIDNYPIYFFSGRMLYVFVTGGAGAIMKSIVANGPLMRKTRVPYYMFPLSAFLSAFVDFLFTLAAFAIVMIFTRTPVSIHLAAFPVVMIELSIFTFGFGLLLAIANIYFRDTNYIYSAFTVAWMYLTPLFYPVASLSDGMRHAMEVFNPLYYYVHQARSIFLDHAWPDGIMMARGFGVGIVLLVLSLCLYNRVKRDMILYI